MRSHCFHSESTSRDYLTREIHPSEKRLPSFFDAGRSFAATWSAREIKVSVCYSKKRYLRKNHYFAKKREVEKVATGPWTNIFLHSRHYFFPLPPYPFPNILIPSMEYRIVRFDFVPRGHDDARVPSRFSSYLAQGKISRAQHLLHLFPWTYGGQFDFREQFWRIPRREPTRKCFEWKKKRRRSMSKSYW